jgi:hypothetical protein
MATENMVGFTPALRAASILVKLRNSWAVARTRFIKRAQSLGFSQSNLWTKWSINFVFEILGTEFYCPRPRALVTGADFASMRRNSRKPLIDGLPRDFLQHLQKK